MSHLAIAGLQLELRAEDNLETIEREIAGVSRRFPWVQMVVLPELCLYGPGTRQAVELPGEAENRLRESARRHGLWLIPGSLFERRDDAVYNTSPVINPDGDVVARYSKRYPFKPYEQGVADGDDFCVFEMPGVGTVGLMICFDMWFPEMARQLTWMGAEALVVPSLTNTIDRDVELALARATAAACQAWFVNINVAGDLGHGRSIVAGPDGTVVHQASSGREIITVDLDFDHARRVRERGLHGLVQTLKSFRDAAITYPCYQEGAGPGAYGTLGALDVPAR